MDIFKRRNSVTNTKEHLCLRVDFVIGLLLLLWNVPINAQDAWYKQQLLGEENQTLLLRGMSGDGNLILANSTEGFHVFEKSDTFYDVGTLTTDVEDIPRIIKFTYDGSSIFAADRNNGYVRIYARAGNDWSLFESILLDRYTAYIETNESTPNNSAYILDLSVAGNGNSFAVMDLERRVDIYRRYGGKWKLEFKVPEDASQIEMSADGRLLAVVSPLPDPTNSVYYWAREVLLYQRQGSGNSVNWVHVDTLTHPDENEHHYAFATSVRMSHEGKYIVVGSPFFWTGCCSNEPDQYGMVLAADNYVQPASVFIFNRTGSSKWTIEKEILNHEQLEYGFLGDDFGNSVSISSVGDRVAISGFQNRFPEPDESGIARLYVYDKIDEDWSGIETLTHLSNEFSSTFGHGHIMSVDGKTLAIHGFSGHALSPAQSTVTTVQFP